MTPEQAFQIVAQMVVNAQATYADHQIAQQALQVLKGLVDAQGTQTPALKEVSDG